MDRVNLRLRDLLQERARLVQAIGRFKRRHGLPMVDQLRERAMLRTMLRGAGPGFDRATLARLLRAILAASRARIGRLSPRAARGSRAS